MPPHCDSLDGPVVTAARKALDAGDVRAVKARALGPEAEGIADRWFFETAVRVHRAGEGAPFTGLKPAGLDVGPVIPAAEGAHSVYKQVMADAHAHPGGHDHG